LFSAYQAAPEGLEKILLMCYNHSDSELGKQRRQRYRIGGRNRCWPYPLMLLDFMKKELCIDAG
jgi:hypothetical protein